MIYLDHLLAATRGAVQQQSKHNQFDAFNHDTRQLTPNELFVAVRGERGNGHDFLLDAIRKGASGLLVEAQALSHLPEAIHTSLAQAEVTVIVVEDTRLALQQYASAILARWKPTVIAVTGSVGKTSTKEAIASVLAQRFQTFRSWQNYNDMLGIPLSLGRLEEQHEYVVLELGCDHPGEIAALCRMVRPTIGILTNISPVQMQYFSSIEHLAGELGALLTSLPDGGHFFYQQDDPIIHSLLAQYAATNHTEITYHPFPSGTEQETIPTQPHINYCGLDGIVGTLTVDEPGDKPEATTLTLRSHLLGQHAMATLLAAYQVGRHAGISSDALITALADLQPLSGRLKPLPGIGHTTLLDDTHNATPTSMLAGLQTLDVLTPKHGRRIAILGDMLHLGSYEEEAHRTIGQQVARYVDYLITRGEWAALIAEEAQHAGLSTSHIIRTSTHEDASQAARRILFQTTTDALNATDTMQSQDIILIKGSEETRMERITEMLMARSWEASELLVRQTPGWKKTIFRHAERPTWVEIDLNAIGGNTRHIKSLVGPQTQVLVALKADAYGHGALKVARTVLQNGATMLGVATVSEAIPLRDAHIDAPILVFGYVPRWQMREAIRLGVSITIYSREEALALSETALDLGKIATVHVKVDTGMGRLGIRFEELDTILELVREAHRLPGLKLEGIYTHFAQADAADQSHARLQLARFQHVIQTLEEQGLRPPIVHASNSAATLAIPEARFDMVRPGIAIYGLEPSPDVHLPEGFRAALSFKTQVSQVKWIPTGEGISYGSTYITTRPTLVAILPVGYADGFRRSPYNWGSVLIHGQEAPLLGRVCMDQCTVDVTNIPQTRMGDEVILIGRQGDAELSAETVATRLGTLNYEVVSELLARVPRVD
ncbi:alanine racemase [Dictyobacter arantiisoli]|uniref:Multifunctional fusion protein n=1 Tax=Dictyobacter arantiisoli TaxID=2014874 RepID=A0A5A5T6C2_9CHLR|nr:alanine racemase [Dictyobacter arantiisoli]GCF06579.1 alanine racemase [Dictyobacter arantiisoli]